jgi:hypothetical protein
MTGRSLGHRGGERKTAWMRPAPRPRPARARPDVLETAAAGTDFVLYSVMTFPRIVIPLYLCLSMIFPENRCPLFRIMP